MDGGLLVVVHLCFWTILFFLSHVCTNFHPTFLKMYIFSTKITKPKVNMITHHPRGKKLAVEIYDTLLWNKECSTCTILRLQQVPIRWTFSLLRKSVHFFSGGTGILRWRTRTASMLFWLLSDCFSDFCETQPPDSIGWVALSSMFVCLFVRLLFVPHR